MARLFRRQRGHGAADLVSTLSENRRRCPVEDVETAQLIKFMPQVVYGGVAQGSGKPGRLSSRRHQLRQPDGDRDTYYLFAYDWRRDNVESARRLAEKIAEIKRRTNEPDLRFDIIAHSMGGLIARYFAMYGDADVLGDRQPCQIGAGRKASEVWSSSRRRTRDSMDALRSLIYGYSITEANKPRINPFTVSGRVTILRRRSTNCCARSRPGFTTPSSTRSKSIFTTSRPGSAATGLRPSTPRLQTVEILDQEIRGERGPPGSGKDPRTPRGLSAGEDKARGFQEALDPAAELPETLRLHLVGGDCEPTVAGALIVDVKRANALLSAHIPHGLRKVAFDKLFIPGDGRVARQSLFGLSFDLEQPDAGIKMMNRRPLTRSSAATLTATCRSIRRCWIIC